MSICALITDELGTLPTKGHGYLTRALLTMGFNLSECLLSLGVQSLHTTDKEGSLKFVRIVFRDGGVFLTLGAEKRILAIGTSCINEGMNAPFAVVVTAR